MDGNPDEQVVGNGVAAFEARLAAARAELCHSLLGHVLDPSGEWESRVASSRPAKPAPRITTCFTRDDDNAPAAPGSPPPRVRGARLGNPSVESRAGQFSTQVLVVGGILKKRRG